MIKFILENKLQFTIVLFINLLTFMFIIYVIALKLNDYIGFMSICFGVTATYFFAINIKEYAKVYRLRILVLYVLFVIVLLQSSKLFLSSEDVLTGTFIGFLIYMLVSNITDTLDNIRTKSKLKK